MLISKPSVNIPNGSINLSCKGVSLERVQKVKYLCLIMDQNLRWRDHISHIKKKISPAAGVFKRLSSLLNDSQTKAVYYALGHCHLNYMDAIWALATSSMLNERQVLQNIAIKRLFNMPHLTPTEEVFKKTGLMNILQNNTLTAAILLFKVQEGLTSISTNFKINS
jgi:hypothetical protein